MFMVIRKKKIVILIIVVAVLSIVGLFANNATNVPADIAETRSDKILSENSNLEVQPGEAVMVNAKEAESDFVEKAKNDRETVRSKVLELLKNTIENESVSKEIKKDAETQMLQIASDMDAEKRIETLLAAKGFAEAVVFISRDVTTVTLCSEGLNETDVAKINDIVFEQSGNNNIKIVEVK